MAAAIIAIVGQETKALFLNGKLKEAWVPNCLRASIVALVCQPLALARDLFDFLSYSVKPNPTDPVCNVLS